ncbi:hypothetical protein HDU93_005566 [Gonapodya sp. JEL0774]|nr:hypothetical protein HDU93_005566 [Gonapodya sp. JEL0774]
MDEEWDAVESSIVKKSIPTPTQSSYTVNHARGIESAPATLGKPTCPSEFDEETHLVMKMALDKIRRQIVGSAFEDDEQENDDLWHEDNPRSESLFPKGSEELDTECTELLLAVGAGTVLEACVVGRFIGRSRH